MKYFALILILLLASASALALQYTIGPSTPTPAPPPPPYGGVADENFYDNLDGTCRNMPATDGPAALPNRCFNTAMESTPAGPGFYCVIPASQGPPPSCNGSLSNYATVAGAFGAINSGVIPCGSIVKIVATSDGTPQGQQNIYNESKLTYPARVCNQSQWIWVETDMLPQLPPESSRISPAWIGVPSLPGRPPYAQPAVPGVYMPKISAGAWQTATIAMTAGTNPDSAASSYVRFIGIEFVQPVPGSAVCTGKNCQNGWQYRILDTSCGPADAKLACPDHVIFDRVIVTPDNHTGRSTVTVCMGGQLTGRSFALINSYVFQIAGQKGYCEPKVTGAGNTKSLDQGPYKFFNNYMEGGAENYFWGGGDTNSNASDIQWRRSHMFKPYTLWMPFRSDYLGTVIAIKNLGESKSAIRMLIEGNLYENTWYGGDANGTAVGDQFATAVLVHSAQGNLQGAHADVAQDMTFRYNIVRHAARAIGLDNAGCSSSALLGCGIIPPGRTTPTLQRLSAHDNVFDDIGGKWYTQPYNGAGNGFDASGAILTNPLLNVGNNVTLNNVFVDHNTFIPSSYSQDLTVASIVTSGTTATLTATGQVPFVGTKAAASLSANKKIQIFGSCPGFNQYANIGTVISLSPVVVFTYPSAPANQTCNYGYVSLIWGKGGGALNMNEGAYDRQVVTVWETNNIAYALVRGWDGSMSPCTGLGTPAGCQSGMQLTIWGLVAANACYNSNQSGCGNDGTQTTPAAWTLGATAYCSANGVGGSGTGPLAPIDFTKCRANGDIIFAFQHIQTGLNAVDPGAAFLSYWPFLGRFNYGPEPNLRWEGITFTNNIAGGRGGQMNGGQYFFPTCTVQVSNNTLPMLDNCGIVATAGPGAYKFRCNVVARWPFIFNVANPTDILPPDNTDTPDSTFQSVGFQNFNFDGLGMGVPDMSDLVLASTSPFKGGLPGCDGKDPGADIPLLKQYTAGVE